MREVEAAFVVEQFYFKNYVRSLANFLELPMEDPSIGLTKTTDFFLDTPEWTLLEKRKSLRVREKYYADNAKYELRLTFKRELEKHAKLMIREEIKAKFKQGNLASVIELLNELYSALIDGHCLVPKITVDEIAQEVDFGEPGKKINVSFDRVVYIDPNNHERHKIEYLLELESHGMDEETLLKAVDWTHKYTGSIPNIEGKYARGLRLLNLLEK